MVAWKNILVKDGKAVATINRGYLGCAQALFHFAVKNRLCESNPCTGVTVSSKARAGTKRLPYTNAEVTRLLNAALNSETPWTKWLPWLAASTGARIGEMSQLHGANITTDNGITVIKIQPAQDGGTIKNEGSERTVPMHPKLIELGFLDFVASKGQGPLFYGKSSGDLKMMHASKAVSNRLAQWIRKNGFQDKRKDPNHALRHWFKSEAANLGILDSVADAIQGHTDSSSAGRYRTLSVQTMSEAIKKFVLPPSETVTL